MFNLQAAKLKLWFGKQSVELGAITYNDLIDGACSFTLTYEEGLELATYVLEVPSIRSWTGHLILHTGIKPSNDAFNLSVALHKFLAAHNRKAIDDTLSPIDRLGLAKFFLGIDREQIVDSKVVLKTCFTRIDGDIELLGD